MKRGTPYILARITLAVWHGISRRAALAGPPRSPDFSPGNGTRYQTYHGFPG
jgi:hypothetical protein